MRLGPVLMFFFGMFLMSGAQARTAVKVRELSTVRIGDPIRLGVLLNGEIGDLELEEKVQNMVVLEPVTTDAIKTVSSQELALSLRRKLSFIELQRLQVIIPEVVRVRAVHNYLYPSDIRHQIKQRAFRSCAPCEVVVEDLIIPDTSSAGEILEWKLDLSQVNQFSSFLAPLIVQTSKGRKTFHVTGKMSLLKEALITKRMISLGESIQESDVEKRKIDIAFSKDGLLSKRDLIGRVANRVITVGQPLYWKDVRQELAVRRGDSVKLQLETGQFELTASGIAEESGAIGDRIRVKSPDGRKTLSGVLIEQGLVRVE